MDDYGLNSFFTADRANTAFELNVFIY
jgi:hypothetical protein